MNKYLVTTGIKYTDIDGFASVIVYAEYLRLKGFDAIAYLPGHMNFSVSETMIEEANGLFVKTPPEDYIDRSAILMDMSDYEYTDKTNIPLQNFVEVIDHHPNFEEFWRARIGKKAQIEVIGATATIVWRKIKVDGLESKISKFMIRLLYTALISNSLYLQAEVTQQEDRIAYKELKTLADINDNYDDLYYKSVEKKLTENVETILEDDAKLVDRPGGGYKIIQVELWKVNGFIQKYRQEIDKILRMGNYKYFFLTIPCISEKKNYIYTPDLETQIMLKKALNFDFGVNNLVITSKLMLRKEIIKLLK